jgi:hypothetical protein
MGITVLWEFFVSWERRFDRPIISPNGETLRTLEDARRYILALPKSEHETTAWQIAIESLLLAAGNPAGSDTAGDAEPERPPL